ncbi:MAG: nucleoside deaminase [Bacilli bacterium]|jgi:guanine deaminase|nr:nucleoside deaminase [Bacilli bacterium]MCH4210194.1 nucleoside deaminase [Bacilli bacterium]MCH4228169.1 nucleoside deaminase [Bacilli bacterium]MCH4277833.1 nucleoside deaminase [Bacilli bacterium]MCI2055192.1 nucleoside deaminase [Bacilli bacterium]
MNKYMEMAISEAKEGIKNHEGGPFGAVIVKDGAVVGKGHNQVIKNGDPTCHGEMMAIHEACKTLNSHDLHGCEIYTTGFPCPMCFCAILWANIDKVYYGCDTVDTEVIGFRDKHFEESIPEKRKDICMRIMHDECLELYEDYAKSQGKAVY